jgi:hypothetical protein
MKVDPGWRGGWGIGLACLLIVLGGCCGRGSNGGPSTPPTTASVSLTLKEGPFPDPGTQPSSTRIVWRLDPVSLSGSAGTSTSTTVDRNYQASGTSTGPGEWSFFYRDQVSGLTPGRWRITASTPSWSSQCERDLAAGFNVANFTENRQGCTAGPGFPGD